MSRYFTIKEMCRSARAVKNGIDNSPTKEAKANMEELMERVLDPLRERVGMAITVTSGYRCEALNGSTGGVKGSQHAKGQAADIVCSDMKRLWEEACKGPYDQLIWEKGETVPAWIHISYKPVCRGMRLRTKDGKHYYAV